MALELETTRPEAASLEITAMDFIGIRRADRATRARRNFSAGQKATFRRQPGLAAPFASLSFTGNRPIFHMYAPRRCRYRELHRSHCFVEPSKDALSRGSAVPGAQTLCPLHSPPEPNAGVLDDFCLSAWIREQLLVV